MSKFDKTDKTEGMEGSLGGTSVAEGAQLGTTGECTLKRTASNANLDVDARPCPSRRSKSNNGQPQPCIESARAALPEEDGAAAAEQPGDDGPPSPPAKRTRAATAARTRASHNAAGRGDDSVVAMEVDGASKTMEKNASPEAAAERSAEHRVGSEGVADAAALDAVASGDETTEDTLWEQEEGSSNEELKDKMCGCGNGASSVWHATGDVERENPSYACSDCEKTKCPTKENRTCPADNAGPSPSPSGSAPARRRPRGFSSYRGQVKESEKVYLDEGPGVTPIADPRYIPQEWNKMMMVEMADQSMVKRGRRTYHDFMGPTRRVKQFSRMLDYLRNHHPDEDLRVFAEEFFSANPEQKQAKELFCSNCGEVVNCDSGNGRGLDYCRPVRHAIGSNGSGGGCRRRHERCPCGVTVEDKGGNLKDFRVHMKDCAFAQNVPAVRRWAEANPDATKITTTGLTKKTNAFKEANRLHKWIRENLGLTTVAATEVKKQALIAVLEEEEVGLTGYL